MDRGLVNGPLPTLPHDFCSRGPSPEAKQLQDAKGNNSTNALYASNLVCLLA